MGYVERLKGEGDKARREKMEYAPLGTLQSPRIFSFGEERDDEKRRRMSDTSSFEKEQRRRQREKDSRMASPTGVEPVSCP